MYSAILFAFLAAADKPTFNELNIDEYVRYGDVAIKVAKVDVAKLQVDDLGRKSVTKEKVSAIYIVLLNLHETKKTTYRGWSRIGERASQATLADEFDNTYRQLNFGIGTRIPGQITGEKTILPVDVVVDVLVFEEFSHKSTRLMLTLPGENIGMEKPLHLSIKIRKTDEELAKEEAAKKEAAKKSEEKAAQDEKDATALIATADKPILQGNYKAAKVILENVVKNYPTTAAGKDAAKRLSKPPFKLER